MDTMEAREIVLKTLKESPNPLKSAEIAILAGIDKPEVDKPFNR